DLAQEAFILALVERRAAVNALIFVDARLQRVTPCQELAVTWREVAHDRREARPERLDADLRVREDLGRDEVVQDFVDPQPRDLDSSTHHRPPRTHTVKPRRSPARW